MSEPGRVEIFQHTPEQVEQILDDALDLLSARELHDELRVPFFQCAVALLSAKQVQVSGAALAALDPERLKRPA